MDAIHPKEWAGAMQEMLTWLNKFITTPAGIILTVSIGVGLSVWVIKAFRKP